MISIVGPVINPSVKLSSVIYVSQVSFVCRTYCNSFHLVIQSLKTKCIEKVFFAPSVPWSAFIGGKSCCFITPTHPWPDVYCRVPASLVIIGWTVTPPAPRCMWRGRHDCAAARPSCGSALGCWQTPQCLHCCPLLPSSLRDLLAKIQHQKKQKKNVSLFPSNSRKAFPAEAARQECSKREEKNWFLKGYFFVIYIIKLKDYPAFPRSFHFDTI